MAITVYSNLNAQDKYHKVAKQHQTGGGGCGATSWDNEEQRTLTKLQ